MLRNTSPFLLTLLFASALITLEYSSAQTGPASEREQRQPTGLGRGRPDTPTYFASSAAATRAIAICSGLWDGEQTMEDIDFYSPLRDDDVEKFKTKIDHDKKIVSINYADDMPPRHVVWRPVLGCTQLPVGATLDAASQLPQVAKSVRAPNLDDQPWPTGDKNAEGSLPVDKQKQLDQLVASAFDGETYDGVSWGVVIVHKGKIVAEQYALNFD